MDAFIIREPGAKFQPGAKELSPTLLACWRAEVGHGGFESAIAFYDFFHKTQKFEHPLAAQS